MTVKQYNSKDHKHQRLKDIFSLIIIIISKNKSKPLKSSTYPYIYKKRKEKKKEANATAFLAVIESFLRDAVVRQHFFFGNPYN